MFPRSTIALLVVLTAGCGDNFRLDPVDADSSIDTSTDAVAGACASSADCKPQGDPCFTDICGPAGVCIHYDLHNCGLPELGDYCMLATDCGDHDQDNDGLFDEWEINGGIDLDCNGVYEADEVMFTNVDPGNPMGASAAVAVPDIFLEYKQMILPDQLTGSGDPVACTLTPEPFFPGTSPDCEFDQVCLAGVCRGHSDGPTGDAVAQVVSAFAARGINLHVDPVHDTIPHARVITFGTPFDLASGNGCAAPDAATLAEPRRAVDFYALKGTATVAAFHDGPRRRPGYHYAVFGHTHTCDSSTDCFACPGGAQAFRSSGLAEVFGNDIIMALGGRWDQTGGVAPPTTINQAATLMHELGHNLGLDHGGAANLLDGAINSKPNFLSVMGFSYQLAGIQTASAPGLTTCSGGCPVRVDFQAIEPTPTTMLTLDETSLTESTGVNTGTNDIVVYFCPGRRNGAGTGAIDWDCDGDATETGVFGDINNGAGTTLVSHADWSSVVLPFVCAPNFTFGDGAAVGTGAVSTNELDWETAATQHLIYPPLHVHASTRRVAGDLEVTLAGSRELEVDQIVAASLELAGTRPHRVDRTDRTGDGRRDLVLRFRARSIGPHTVVTGHLASSQSFEAPLSDRRTRSCR